MSDRDASRLMPGAVHLWVARESQLDDAALALRYRAFLTPEELARERRFLVDGARRLHLLARALQRVVLASCLPRAAPAELRFLNSTSGRPSLAAPFDAGGLEFNLAHTRGLVVLAVGQGMQLGVDAEWRDRRAPLQVARSYFSAAEADALEALPPAAQPERFLRLWTLKEAYLKGTGAGIVGGLDSITFDLERPGEYSFAHDADPDSRRWHFRQYALGDEHLVALACAPAQAEVVWHEFADGEEQPLSLAVQALISPR